MRSRILLALLILIVLLASCSKAEFTVSSIQVQPYVCREDGRMGMSVFVVASDKDENSVQFSLKDPSGNLSWSFGASKVTLDSLDFLGSSDITMPLGSPLPEGQWELVILYKDGTRITKSFIINYGDASLAMDNYRESGAEGAWYDSSENLTVLP